MLEHKLIFIGPVGAGKTTAVRLLSDDNNVTTDAAVSDVTSRRKATTTVAMDYGCLLADQHKIHLYGTPGQARFKFMWQVLAQNLAHDCSAVVMMLDNSRNYPQRDLKYYLSEFNQLISRKPLHLVVTRSDLRAEPRLEQYQQWLAEEGLEAPVHFIDGRDRKQLLDVLAAALPAAEVNWQAIKDACSAYTATPPEEEDVALVSKYSGEEVVVKDSIIDDLLNIKGVQGAALANAMGDITTSSMEQSEWDDLVGFVAGIVPVFEQVSDFGTVQSVVLKGGKTDPLSVFVESDQVLGVRSSARVSPRILKQQIEDLLQWG